MSDTPSFRGAGYKTAEDHTRLSNQHGRIKDLMLDGQWRTLEEIHTATGDPTPSISAQLRFLTTSRFGGYIKKRQIREGHPGLYEYQILPPPKQRDPITDEPIPTKQGAFWADFAPMLRRRARQGL